MLDWNDIILHATAAFFGVSFLSLSLDRWVPIKYFVIFNTVFWPTREIIQHESFTRIFTSTQSLLEWTVPVITGILAGLVFRTACGVKRK